MICGLGNPGAEYEATRHNVGWWLLDRLATDWGLGPFRRQGRARVASGRVGGRAVWLLKPLTYMNRSGDALGTVRSLAEFDVSRDLLVVVDDVALDVGRVRFRAQGSAGGHNGLKSIEAALRTRAYPRLRIGVGVPPPGADLAEWVLSPLPAEDEETILGRFDDLEAGVRLWLDEDDDAAARRVNR